MASPKMKEASSKFPEGDADAELNPGKNRSVEADSTAYEAAATSLQIKERAEAEEKEKKETQNKEKKESVQTLKTTIVVSGVIVALIGAIFALTKKLREK